MKKLVTIDGTENEFKNEVCKKVAEKLNCYWVSTETFYRGLAFMCLYKKLNLDEVQPILNTIFYDNWEVKIRAEKTLFFYMGHDITEQLQIPEVTEVMNQLKEEAKIKKHLLNAQRDCAELDRGLVAGGFDCGTKVFPKAEQKFYLAASGEETPAGKDVITIDTADKSADEIANEITAKVG